MPNFVVVVVSVVLLLTGSLLDIGDCNFADSVATVVVVVVVSITLLADVSAACLVDEGVTSWLQAAGTTSPSTMNACNE